MFIFGISAWDINKSDPQCKGISAPGILDTKSGSFFGGKVKSKCVAKYYKCNVKSSGSIIPPKVSSFSCIDEKGCQYTGLNMFGLPMRRLKGNGCIAENIKETDC